jgi:hypothetical protein
MNHKIEASARKKWIWNIGVAAFLSLLLPACRLAPPLGTIDLSGAGWKVQQGQAVWKPQKNAPELAGDLLIATNHINQRAVVQFTKTPLPLVVAQTTSNSWQIEIPAQKKFYSGYGRPPARLGWFFLPNALAGTVPPKPWSFTRDGEKWVLENSSTGQRIEGFLE